MSRKKEKPKVLPAVKISFWYSIVGYCWVLFTNRLFFHYSANTFKPFFPFLKGIIFVSISGIFIFFLAKYQINKIYSLQAENSRILQDRATLLQELHHRVKNNLQVLMSFTSLEISNSANQDSHSVQVLRRLNSRLSMLSAIHQNIYNLPSVPYIDMQTVLSEALPAYGNYLNGTSTCGLQLEQDLDNLQLPITIAVPLALILNELLLNSCTHAYPNVQKSEKVLLAIKQTSTSIYAIVEDYGIGFDDSILGNATSLGLTIVQILTDQLHGIMTKPPTKTGTSIKITFPYSPEINR